MKIPSPSFTPFLIVIFFNFANCWKEWVDSNAPTSTTISSTLYSAGVSFVSWTQTDANTLCSTGECGPYCDSTSSPCINNSLRDLTSIPSPSGTTSGDSSCSDFCCSVENCLRTLNSNGVEIGINKEYVLTFGGREVTAADETTLLFDKCEIDDIQITNDGSCVGTILGTLYLHDIEGNTKVAVTPLINTNITIMDGVSAPPARYGHTAVFVTRSVKDENSNFMVTRKFMYIYGGYSSSCGGYCSDFWRYEIPWAAQRYYPTSSVYWNRGNYWEQLNTTTNPGNRTWSSMVTDGTDAIYLFGGVLKQTDGTKIWTNDIWKYNITNNTWVQVKTKKVFSAIRSVRLWDGTWQNIEGDINQINNKDIQTLIDLPMVPCVVDARAPSCRGFASFAYDSTKSRLIVSGGYSSDKTIPKNYKSYIWTFQLDSNFPVWTQFDIGSDQILTPGAPAFASSVYISTAAYQFHFSMGGIISSTETRNDLWAYDFALNKSTQINNQPLSDTQTYPQLNKGMTLIGLSKNPGLFLFGGYLKNELSPLNQLARTQYMDECLSVITAAGFSLSDSLGTAWSNYYASTSNTCFDPTRIQFYLLQNQFTISKKMWTYMESYCRITDTSLGTCFWGRAGCASNRYGANCENLQCINSLCYQEKTSLTEAVCIHCYARGECVNGVCQCDEGHTFDDCSGVDCPNSCSNTATETVATCILRYPLSVCQCEKSTKRGGDDCSYIFCLNDCGGHGDCIDGVCKCNANYYGLDCSIFDVDFIADVETSFQLIHKLHIVPFILGVFSVLFL